jgi:AcrR family transcriptional regulator
LDRARYLLPHPATAEPSADGRRRRGEDSRARIVQAMLDLVREGFISPSAEQVAVRAEVGLRTVFRHFKDLESLYGEMSGVIENELMTLADTPFKAVAWRERVLELVERRGWAYERIAPFKRASEVLRHQSEALALDNAKFVAGTREILRRELPANLAADRDVFEAIDLLLSFDAWRRLRQDQELSPLAAKEVLQKTISALLDRLGV